MFLLFFITNISWANFLWKKKLWFFFSFVQSRCTIYINYSLHWLWLAMILFEYTIYRKTQKMGLFCDMRYACIIFILSVEVINSSNDIPSFSIDKDCKLDEVCFWCSESSCINHYVKCQRLKLEDVFIVNLSVRQSIIHKSVHKSVIGYLSLRLEKKYKYQSFVVGFENFYFFSLPWMTCKYWLLKKWSNIKFSLCNFPVLLQCLGCLKLLRLLVDWFAFRI